MPETVLMGPDGGPAIDARTGMQLTMEEMLRRNGIVGNRTTTSMLGPNEASVAAQSASNPATAANGPTTAAAAAMMQNGGASHTANPGSPTDTTTNPSPSVSPEQTAEALATSNVDPDTVGMLEKLGVLAGGTAAAYLAYRALRKGSPDGVARGNGGVAGAGNGATDIIDGEFTEVPETRSISGKTSQQLKSRQQKALPAPTKALPAPKGNDRLAAAKALQERAARGGPNDVGTIAGTPPVRTVSEAPEAGLSRTLGIPQAVIDLLKKNPGIVRTLARH